MTKEQIVLFEETLNRYGTLATYDVKIKAVGLVGCELYRNVLNLWLTQTDITFDAPQRITVPISSVQYVRVQLYYGEDYEQ